MDTSDPNKQNQFDNNRDSILSQLFNQYGIESYMFTDNGPQISCKRFNNHFPFPHGKEAHRNSLSLAGLLAV